VSCVVCGDPRSEPERPVASDMFTSRAGSVQRYKSTRLNTPFTSHCQQTISHSLTEENKNWSINGHRKTEMY
jgi:hypothetical protein